MKQRKDKKISEVKKPTTIDELQALAQSFIKPGTPPLLDAHAFYNTRKPRI